MSQSNLKMEQIVKSFGAVNVLKGVDFDLAKGEVHALVGGNGAGKSTLMKIMTGVYTKDSGKVIIKGEEKEIKSTNDAKENGIAMIFQEMSLVPSLTIAENIFLGYELKKHGMRDVKLMKQETEKVLKRLGLDLDPGTPVSELSVGLCQMVEIAKAVSKNASILVFDEPSAALSDSETEFLFKMIRQLKEEGVSMVYISHRMNEILEICDRVTVIRDGKKVITEKVENLTMEEIVAQMMGNEAKETKFEYVPREYDRNAEDLLTVKHLKINDKIDDINFSIKPGQILGLAGLMGAGRTEIMETLFGLRKAVSGSIELEGKKVEIKNPSDAVACGFALVPEDRRKEGLVLSHTIKENAILPISAQLVKNGIFNDDKAAHDIVEKNIQDLGVVADNMNQEIRLLSGGNQQKIVIAKWLNSNPKIFMFDEPTAGVDIVAKGEIISIIREFADKGGAVIFASSELAEMMAICDDIITIFDGKITGRIGRKELMKEEELQHAIQRK